MGWSSGSSLFGDVIAAVSAEVAEYDRRHALYLRLIPAFEDADWDCQQECLGRDGAYDDALYDIHPDWLESYED